MKTRVLNTDTTTIVATLTQREYETILADAVLRTEQHTVPDHAVRVEVGDKRNLRQGTIEPVEFGYDVIVTIDNTKLPQVTQAK